MQEIIWPANDLLASQEELCYVELVVSYNSREFFGYVHVLRDGTVPCVCLRPYAATVFSKVCHLIYGFVNLFPILTDEFMKEKVVRS
jgi:hypothetical protein